MQGGEHYRFNQSLTIRCMNDFQKFAIALSDFQLDIEDEKQMESLYEKIKGLDCYDLRIFY